MAGRAMLRGLWGPLTQVGSVYENSSSRTVGNYALLYSTKLARKKMLLFIMKLLLFRKYEYALKGHGPLAFCFRLSLESTDTKALVLGLLSPFLILKSSKQSLGNRSIPGLWALLIIARD